MRSNINFVALPSMDEYILTTENHILYCKASGNYTHIHLSDGSVVVLSKKLKQITSELDSDYFVRVHHSYLVNLLHAKKFIKKYGGQLLLVNGETVDVSRSKKKELFDRLHII